MIVLNVIDKGRKSTGKYYWRCSHELVPNTL